MEHASMKQVRKSLKGAKKKDLKETIVIYNEMVKIYDSIVEDAINKIDQLESDIAESAAVASLYSSVAKSFAKKEDLEAKKVQIQDKTTRIRWSDGTSTVAKCLEEDEYDKEKGILIAALKKYMTPSQIKALLSGKDDKVKDRKHLETVYAKLFSDNKDESVSALKEWEALDANVRQSVKAKF